MPRNLAIALAGLLLFLTQQPSQALPQRTQVQVYKGGLNFPIDMAWVPGTRRIFFTEKTGAIRVMKGTQLVRHPCATLDVNSDGERGALGIVLDPRFKSNHFLYVYYTNASPLENRVARFVVDKTSCTTKKDIITGISASSAGYHNGGQLEFVGNKLFVSVGEAHDAGNAQDRSSRLGKILRYKRDGSIPKGNPFSGSGGRNPVWSYGHRNPFGLARKPGSHKLYETENGPDCDDEVNLIRKAHNYGWGNNYQCGSAGVGTNPSRSLIHWTPTIVPTDPWWYRGRMKSLSGSLFMGDYGNGKLHRFIMNSTGTAITADRIIHDDSSGITDVSKGPGGWLYFLTSDAIKRIIPR